MVPCQVFGSSRYCVSVLCKHKLATVIHLAVLCKCGDKISIIYHSINYRKVLVMSGKIHWCQVLMLFYNHRYVYFAGIIHDKECKSAPGLLPVCRYDALLKDGGRWMWWFNMYIQHTPILLISIPCSIRSAIFDFFCYKHFYLFYLKWNLSNWFESVYYFEYICFTKKVCSKETVSSMLTTYKQGRHLKSIWAISFSLSQVLNFKHELLCEQLARVQYDDMMGRRCE